MMDYNSIYTQILDIPQEIKIMPAGKNPNSSKKYVSKPLRRNECLKRIFGIDANDALFDHAFQQVTSGKGQELKRITTLQSSSLLGLLVFYRVTKYPVIINNIKYTQAFFEVESNVLGSNSSIDVMLVSEDSRILLFLELKFTEFLSLGDYYWIDTGNPRFTAQYNSYLSIYARTMNQCEKLKECIKNDLRITIDYNIEVLKEPLSYQKDIKGIDGNSPFMPKVKDIYRL